MLGAECSQACEQEVEGLTDSNSTFESTNPTDGSAWVDIFVQEMMNAMDLDDARCRAARILEAFEKNIVDHARSSGEVMRCF